MTLEKELTANTETFQRFVGTFLMIQELEIAKLKHNIAINQDKAWPSEFKAQLAAVIKNKLISRRDYELITDHEFESDEEYHDWLKSVWSYLYEDGPNPE